MIAATATQGVMITAIIAAAGVVITALVGYFGNVTAIVKSRQQAADDHAMNEGTLKHRERMNQVEYDRAIRNAEQDRQRFELEHLREARALGVADETPKLGKER